MIEAILEQVNLSVPAWKRKETTALRNSKLLHTACHSCHKYHERHQKPARASPVPQVPRLPHEVKVHVAKCHACHTDGRRCFQMPRLLKKQPRRQRDPSAPIGPPARQSEGQCRHVPHLPHRMDVDASKCHACRTNSCGANGTQARHKGHLPDKVKVNVATCHTCHTEWTSMLPNATPAAQTAAAPTGPKRATRATCQTK